MKCHTNTRVHKNRQKQHTHSIQILGVLITYLIRKPHIQYALYICYVKLQALKSSKSKISCLRTCKMLSFYLPSPGQLRQFASMQLLIQHISLMTEWGITHRVCTLNAGWNICCKTKGHTNISINILKNKFHKYALNLHSFMWLYSLQQNF